VNPVGQDMEIDVGAHIAAPTPGSQRLIHRLQDGRWPMLCPLDEIWIGTRCLVHRYLYGGAMRHCASRDGHTQGRDLPETRPAGGFVKSPQRLVRDTVEIVVVSPEQLDEQSFFRLEVVVEAARLDSGRMSDVVHRGSQARCRDQRCRRLEYLCAPSSVVGALPGRRFPAPARHRHAGLPSPVLFTDSNVPRSDRNQGLVDAIKRSTVAADRTLGLRLLRLGTTRGYPESLSRSTGTPGPVKSPIQAVRPVIVIINPTAGPATSSPSPHR
jgi:hypothetical protein